MEKGSIDVYVSKKHNIIYNLQQGEYFNLINFIVGYEK